MPFAKGQSGNPAGRPPKKRPFADVILERAETPYQPGHPYSKQQAFAILLWGGLTQGRIAFGDGITLPLTSREWLDLVRLILNHVDGTPPTSDPVPSPADPVIPPPAELPPSQAAESSPAAESVVAPQRRWSSAANAPFPTTATPVDSQPVPATTGSIQPAKTIGSVGSMPATPPNPGWKVPIPVHLHPDRPRRPRPFYESLPPALQKTIRSIEAIDCPSWLKYPRSIGRKPLPPFGPRPMLHTPSALRSL